MALSSASDYLVHALLVAGLAGTLVAAAGLFLRARRRNAYGGGWGLAVGSSAVVLGHALLLLSVLATAARGTAANPAPLVWGHPIILVGVVVLDARVLPRWCGLLLVSGYPLVALPWGSWAGTWMMLGSVWAAVGCALLSGGGSTRAAVPRTPHVHGRPVRERRSFARVDRAQRRAIIGDRPSRRRSRPPDRNAGNF